MKNPSPLHTLSFRLSADNAGEAATPDAPLRFSGVAYSGGVVPAYGWRGDVAIDLATLKNQAGDELPVLVDHNARIDAIAGKGRISTHTSADGVLSLHIEGSITRSTEAGQRIAALMAEGFPLQMSVGMAANFRETTQPLNVNGQTLAVAGVFEQPHIREVSFVPVGADPATSAGQSFSFSPSFQPPSPAKEPKTMSRTAEDEALIAGLQQQITDLSAAIEAQRIERRTADLSALMADVGRDAPTGDAAKPYMAMADEAFATFSADLRAVAKSARPAADRSLFGAQSTNRAMQNQGGASDANDPGKALLASVARMSARTANL